MKCFMEKHHGQHIHLMNYYKILKNNLFSLIANRKDQK